MSDRTAKQRLESKAERGFQGYPLATIAFYGPDNQRASKVAVAIVRGDRQRSSDFEMRKWFADAADLREDETTATEILAFLDERRVRSVTIGPGILGCPHEEVIDYPLGESCPLCPYWAGRPRPI